MEIKVSTLHVKIFTKFKNIQHIFDCSMKNSVAEFGFFILVPVYGTSVSGEFMIYCGSLITHQGTFNRMFYDEIICRPYIENHFVLVGTSCLSRRRITERISISRIRITGNYCEN